MYLIISDSTIRYLLSTLDPIVAILTSASISSSLPFSSFQSLLAPSFSCFFFPPLFANLIYAQMSINMPVLVCYFLGLLMGVYGIRPLHFYAYVGKASLLIALIANKHTALECWLWMVVCEFVGMMVRRFWGGGDCCVGKRQLMSFGFCLLIILIGKIYFLPYFFVLLSVILYGIIEVTFTRKNLKMNNDSKLKMNNDSKLKMNNDTKLKMNNESKLKINNDSKLKINNDSKLKMNNDSKATKEDKMKREKGNRMKNIKINKKEDFERIDEKNNIKEINTNEQIENTQKRGRGRPKGTYKKRRGRPPKNISTNDPKTDVVKDVTNIPTEVIKDMKKRRK